MKKLLLILLIIPAVISAQKDKNLTQKEANKLLKEAEISPPRGGGWQLKKSNESKFIFQAVNGLSGPFELYCVVDTELGHLRVAFMLLDPQKLVTYTVFDENMVSADFAAVSFVETDSNVGFIYYENMADGGAILLNIASIISKKTKKVEIINFGKIIFTHNRFVLNTGRTRRTPTWYLHNNMALYAAAYTLIPGLTYDEFLNSMEF